MHIGNKIVIIGVSASGKSTFARKLADITKLPVTLMDSVMWNPGWDYIGDEATVKKLHEITAGDTWIIEGYITQESRIFVFDRADTIIYLDYPRRVAALRYIKRWWKHRKNPRPELAGSPEQFDFTFLKLIWDKEETTWVDSYLKTLSNQAKIIRLNSTKAADNFLRNL